MIDESSSKDKLYKAIISVTDKMSAEKDGKNPHFRSDYMTLDGILNAVKPILKSVGIAVMQSTHSEEGTLTCETRLIHESGEWISATCQVHVDKLTPQGYGSAITYARRYGICSILGIAENDDDGNQAELDTKKPSAARVAAEKKADIAIKSDAPKKLDNNAVKKIIDAFDKFGVEEELIEKRYGDSNGWDTDTRKKMLADFELLGKGEMKPADFLTNLK